MGERIVGDRGVQDNTIMPRESPKKGSSRFVDTEMVNMDPARACARSSVYKLWLCCLVLCGLLAVGVVAISNPFAYAWDLSPPTGLPC